MIHNRKLNDYIQKLISDETSVEDVVKVLTYIEDMSYLSNSEVTTLGKGYSSNVYLIDGKAYKTPVIENEEDEDFVQQLNIVSDADYKKEAEILKELKDIKSVVDALESSQYTLVTEYIKGNTLNNLSDEMLIDISPHTFNVLADDVVRILYTGYIPIDLNSSNIIYDKNKDELKIIDVGEFLSLDSYMKNRSIPPMLSLLYTQCIKNIDKHKQTCVSTRLKIDKALLKLSQERSKLGNSNMFLSRR